MGVPFAWVSVRPQDLCPKKKRSAQIQNLPGSRAVGSSAQLKEGGSGILTEVSMRMTTDLLNQKPMC